MSFFPRVSFVLKVGLLINSAQIMLGQDQCVALLRHGMYNTYRSTSGSSTVSGAKSDFCNAYSSFKQSGQSASLEASYKVFSGSASYNQQSVEALASSVCGSNMSHAQANAVLDTLSSVIDSNAIDAYKTCVASSAVGLVYKIIPSEVSANTISVQVQYKQSGTPNTQKITKVSISQDAQVSIKQKVACEGNLFTEGNRPGGVVLTSEVLSMVCTRSSANVATDAFSFLNRRVLAAPVTIAVHTNLGIINAELAELPLTALPPPSVFTPVGSVVAFAGEKEPDGWMLCDGRALPRNSYAELFGAIGVAHGHGDAVTTFNIPDYRGRFLRGTDWSANLDPDHDQRSAAKPGGLSGNRVGSIQADSLARHAHPTTVNGALIAQVDPNAPNKASNAGFEGVNGGGLYGPYNGYGTVTVQPEGGRETRPNNAGVNFIIRVR
jgi:microcystin-dependent protein